MVWIGVAGSEGITLKKHSPFMPFLKRTYMEMIQSGQIEKMKIKHGSATNCDPIKVENRKSLSYQKLILLFLVIGGGMTLAICVLTFEILKNLIRPSAQKSIKKVTTIPNFKDISTQTT